MIVSEPKGSEPPLTDAIAFDIPDAGPTGSVAVTEATFARGLERKLSAADIRTRTAIEIAEGYARLVGALTPIGQDSKERLDIKLSDLKGRLPEANPQSV